MTRLPSCVVTRSLCLQEGLAVLPLSHRPAPTSFFPTSCHVPVTPHVSPNCPCPIVFPLLPLESLVLGAPTWPAFSTQNEEPMGVTRPCGPCGPCRITSHTSTGPQHRDTCCCHFLTLSC